MIKQTISRRQLIQAGITVGAMTGVMFSGLVKADWPTAAYQQKDQKHAMEKLFGDKLAKESDKISLRAPELAENGAVVPVNIKTELPNVKSISIFVENNPNPLAARFNMVKNQQGKVSTRIKLAKQSQVTAIVETDQGLFMKSQLVKVTRGGCGG